MAKHATAEQTSTATVRIRPPGANIVDMRTRQRWRPPNAPAWPFLLDIVITLSVVLLGTWLFHKMRGG
jgi:hypothetical protein